MGIRFVLVSTLACAPWLFPSTASARPLSDWLTEEVERAWDSQEARVEQELRAMLLVEIARNTRDYAVDDFAPCQLEAMVRTAVVHSTNLPAAPDVTLGFVRLQFTRGLLDSLDTAVYEIADPEAVDGQIVLIARAMREAVAARLPDVVTTAKLKELEWECTHAMLRMAALCTEPAFKTPLPAEALEELLAAVRVEPLPAHVLRAIDREFRLWKSRADDIIGVSRSASNVGGEWEVREEVRRGRDVPITDSEKIQKLLSESPRLTIYRVVAPRWRAEFIDAKEERARAARLQEAYERAGVGAAEATRVIRDSAPLRYDHILAEWEQLRKETESEGLRP